MAHTLTTCTFCGVGCGIYLDFKQLELPIPNYHPEDLLEKDGMIVYQKMDHV